MEHDFFWMYLVSERLRQMRAEAAEHARAHAARTALGPHRRVHNRPGTPLGRGLIRVRGWLAAHARPRLEKIDWPETEESR
jgi:hypothetical protein